MAKKKTKKNTKVRDMKPRKDAKGGKVISGHSLSGHSLSGHSLSGHSLSGHSLGGRGVS